MDIQSYMHSVGREARKASRAMARADTAAKDQALLAMAAAIDRDPARLLEANLRDVDGARAKGLAPAMVDRLALTPKNVAAMAEGLRQIAQLRDPVGAITDLNYRPSGIQVGRMRVPLGVVAIIYEARPNVTADAAGLCLKAGNAAILRGGSEAIHSNQAIVACVHEGLRSAGLPESAVQVIETTDRAAVGELITMKDYVDIIVPRGGKGLIERITAESRIPVLKHLDGVCHVYIDDRADLDKAIRIADNAKTQRYGTCNTMETRWCTEHRRAVPRAVRIYRQGCGCAAMHSARQWSRRSKRPPKKTGTPNLAPIPRIRASAASTRPSVHHPYGRSHRRHRHRGLHSRAPFPKRGGLELRTGECFHPLRRWVRVRPGCGDRHFHRQAARARTGWAGRPNVAEIHRARGRPDPRVSELCGPAAGLVRRQRSGNVLGPRDPLGTARFDRRRQLRTTMSSVIEVKVPDIGDYKDVPVIEVLVKPGDTIKKEDSLVTLESDKATMEVPAPEAGVVKELRVKLGDKVSEGVVLLLLERDGTAAAAKAPAPKTEAPAPRAEAPTSPSATALPPAAPVAVSSAAVAKGDYHADVMVLGSGPGGYTAAFRAADLGKKVVLIERYADLGGVCLNVGCIPSKALLHAARVLSEAEEMSHFGLKFGKPEIDLTALRTWKENVVAKGTKGLSGLAKQRKVQVVTGVAKFTGPHQSRCKPRKARRRSSLRQLRIIAVGRRREDPRFPADDTRACWTPPAP